MMAEICVIDDQAVIRESVAETLERAHHRVTAFADASVAVEAIRQSRFDLVITDLKMPKLDGLGVIRAARESKCDVPIMVMTAYGTISSAVEAMKLGAFDFVQKPFEVDNLSMQVDRALQHRRLRLENEAWRTSLADLRKDREMIGGGQAMQRVRQQIKQFAASEATVLIAGESGTGKELVAGAIHASSSRGDKPMLCLNCAALSGNLLESELFGHERGSFTGADRQRKGRFELADGGTLLLDEISEMALALQGKLLRVLQEGEFERVGSSVTLRADVRVIATTNRNLEDWVAKKRFRQDLYYRLNVLPLHLPPLRDRRGDVADMVHYFLSRLARQSGQAVLRVEPAAMRLLTEYGWPGNVRELENVCQRAVAMTGTGVLRAEDIQGWIRGAPTSVVEFSNLRSGRLLEDAERQLIERTLKQHGGHRAKSAKALGMGVRTLGLKLKQWREQDTAEKRTARPTLASVG